MHGRRSLIGAGLLAGLGAAAGAAAEQAREPQRSDDDDMKKVVDSVRGEVNLLRTNWDPGSGRVAAIRQAQRTFLKGQNKFPDFIDVGIAVWEDIYDWHVRFQQPLNISRQPDGRYVMAFTQTLLVLRPEHTESYIGIPYDRG